MWDIQLFKLNYCSLEAKAVAGVVDSGWLTMGEKNHFYSNEILVTLENVIEILKNSPSPPPKKNTSPILISIIICILLLFICFIIYKYKKKKIKFGRRKYIK